MKLIFFRMVIRMFIYAIFVHATPRFGKGKCLEGEMFGTL